MLTGKTRLVCVIVMLLAGGMASAQPATRPANAGGPAGRGDQLFQRLHDAISDLNLTDDQKTQIEAIFSKAKDDFQLIAPQLKDMQQQERQQKIRDMMMDLREKIGGVLTDDQKQKLQEKIQAMRGGGAGRLFRGTGAGAPAGAAAAQPQTPPAQDGSLPPRVQQPLDRLEESLATLGLSGEQKTQVQSIVDDGKKQLADVREKVQNGSAKPDDMRAESQQIFAAMRDQLAGVLTTDQQQKLRDAIQSRVDQANTPAAPTTKPAMMMEPPEPRMPPRMQDAPPAESAPKQQALAPTDAGPKLGEPAPELALDGLNGRNVQLSSFKGKPLVIEFGSYTSPSFRQRAAKMEELARQYNTRASFLLVYTKEAHATGEWELDRNRDDGIRVAKHADLSARKSAAKDAKQVLKINLIPIAIDNMDDAAMKAFGAGENSAIVVGRDGKIIAKEAWCDPFRLRAALDDATMAKPTTQID